MESHERVQEETRETKDSVLAPDLLEPGLVKIYCLPDFRSFCILRLTINFNG